MSKTIILALEVPDDLVDDGLALTASRIMPDQMVRDHGARFVIEPREIDTGAALLLRDLLDAPKVPVA